MMIAAPLDTAEGGGARRPNHGQRDTDRDTPGPARDVWPPHDPEESIPGSDLHQGTITNLRLGINEAARLGLPPGQPVPW